MTRPHVSVTNPEQLLRVDGSFCFLRISQDYSLIEISTDFDYVFLCLNLFKNRRAVLSDKSGCIPCQIPGQKMIAPDTLTMHVRLIEITHRIFLTVNEMSCLLFFPVPSVSTRIADSLISLTNIGGENRPSLCFQILEGLLFHFCTNFLNRLQYRQ